MLRDSRPVVWIKAARKDFEDFPEEAQTGIKTPKAEIDLIRQRLRRVKDFPE
jgi:phage-related protein